jgi:prevent-host-death family protein
MTLQQVGGREARGKFTELLDAVQKTGARFEITRWGETSAVLVPEGWHERAQRAMAIVEGLANLAHADKASLQQFVAALKSLPTEEVPKAS